MEPQDKSIYVISLDAVDLNLLPTIYRTTDNSIAPLWRYSNLERRNNEYYEFKIKNRDSEETVKDQKPKLDFENIICHICDIEVPKPFASEHRKSSRHQTNLKIADVAIHRMRQCINNTDSGDSNTHHDDIDASIYFCSICADVFDIKNKSAHEKSIAHKNGLILEKIFNDFLNYYHCNVHDNDGDVNNGVRDLDEKIKGPIQKHANDIRNTNDSPISSIESIKPKHNDVPKTDASSTEKEPSLLNDYFESLKKRIGHPMFFNAHNDNNIIEIKTIDGSVVKVSKENFHSFNRTGKRFIQCFVCKEVFKTKSLVEHIISENHIKYMIAPLKDKHCARQIDNISSHCLICNKITENPEQHALCDKDHDSKLKEAVISDKVTEENKLNFSQASTKKQLRLDEDNSTVFDDKFKEREENDGCETKQNDTNNTDQFNIESDQAKQPNNNLIQKRNQGSQGLNPNEYFCTNCNEFICMFRVAEHKTTEKHVLNLKSKFHYLMREIENKLTCKVCQCAITNSIEHVRDHVLEKEHREKYRQLLEDNKIMNVQKGILYCEPCQEIVLIKNELIHINTKSHHVKCFNVKLDEKNGEDENEEKTFIEYFQCEVCKVKLPNHDWNIQEHMNGKSHVTKAGEKNHTSDEKTDKQNEIPYPHYQMEPSKYANVLNCKVCNVNVLHKELSIAEHLIHVQHIKNYTKLLNDNYMVLKQDNNYYCNVCDVTVSANNEVMHAYGKRHKKTLSKQMATKLPATGTMENTDDPSISNIIKVKEKDKLSYADVSNKPTVSNPKLVVDTNVMATSNINKKDTSMSVCDNLVLVDDPDIEPEMLALLMPTDHPKNVICKVCNVALPYNKHNISTHMNGLKHGSRISLNNTKS